MDAGYIVYVGSGEDTQEQKAAFKAEGQGLQDLANECSFAPKGARVEDRYETNEDGVYRQAYAKVAVDFQSCEDAKNAADAAQIQKLANVAFTEEIKRYQEMMNEPPPPPIADQGTAEGSPPPPSGGGYYAGPPRTTVMIVQDEPSFFVVRQQVAYVKQTVILAPPPAPGAPPPQLAAIQGPSRQIHDYEQANPTLKTSQRPWSQVRTTVPPEMGGGPAHTREAMERPESRQAQNGNNRAAHAGRPNPQPRKAPPPRNGNRPRTPRKKRKNNH